MSTILKQNERMVTREEFEKAFAESAEKFGIAEVARREHLAEGLQDMMIQLSHLVNNSPKWIPVNEQVPEFWKDNKHDDAWHERTKRSYSSDSVLVYAQHAQLGCWSVFWAEYIKTYNWKEAKWEPAEFIGIGNPICNVTHWMPFPEAPKN